MASFWDWITAPFTGAPVKESSQQANQAIDTRLQDLSTLGNAAVTQAYNVSNPAAATAQSQLAGATGQGADALMAGRDQGLQYLKDAFSGASSAYNPLSDINDLYARGANAYANATGVNGQAGTDEAFSNFREDPGYKYRVNEALTGATNKFAAAGGGALGGNALKGLTEVGHGLADQGYKDYIDRLSGYNPLAASTAGALSSGKAGLATGLGTGAAGLASGGGKDLASLFSDMGTKASSLSQQQGQFLGGLSLDQLKAMVGATTPSYNPTSTNYALAGDAGMQGAGNFWDLFGNAAKGYADYKPK